jgi:predicted SprT family Zn-dependent metalloprotease
MNGQPNRSYVSLDQAYHYFNAKLFGGSLPAVLITLHRHKGAYGYFHGGIFSPMGGDAKVDELALNPSHFHERDQKAILSTLVHEMAHVWQHHEGTPSRNGYHNSEWAQKMMLLGLHPSDTGAPGGKTTGQRVSHYIQPGLAFDVACEAFLAKHAGVLYGDRQRNEEEVEKKKKKNASKTKFSCLGCGQNAWAKPEARLICGDCEEVMEAEVQGDEGEG